MPRRIKPPGHAMQHPGIASAQIRVHPDHVFPVERLEDKGGESARAEFGFEWCAVRAHFLPSIADTLVRVIGKAIRHLCSVCFSYLDKGNVPVASRGILSKTRLPSSPGILHKST